MQFSSIYVNFLFYLNKIYIYIFNDFNLKPLSPW